MGSSSIPMTTRHSAKASRWRLSPLDILRSPWANRDLVSRLGRREIEARYRGSVLGLFWAIMQPLVLLAVYTFVFGMVFQAKAPRMGMEDAAAENGGGSGALDTLLRTIPTAAETAPAAASALGAGLEGELDTAADSGMAMMPLDYDVDMRDMETATPEDLVDWLFAP